MFHRSTTTGGFGLLVVSQVECSSALISCVGQKCKKMRKTAVGAGECTKTASLLFFFFLFHTKWLAERSDDKQFGNISASSFWLALLVAVGSQRHEW